MRLLPLLLLALSILLPVLPAAAHTELVATTPESDGTVADPPIEVVLEFDEALAADPPPAVRVVDPAGDDLVSAPPTLDGAVVTVPLNLAVAPGIHTVDWVITADDGDEQMGTFTFTFQPPQDIATPPDAAPPTPTPSVTATPPPPTPTPTQTATAAEPTPSPAPTEPSPSPTATETSDEADDGGVPIWLGVMAAVAAVAAVGAFTVARTRRDGDLGDGS